LAAEFWIKFRNQFATERNLLLMGGSPPTDELVRDHGKVVSCPLPEPRLLVTVSPKIEDKAITTSHQRYFRGSEVFDNCSTHTFELSHDPIYLRTK
jgi:hypothetical protein